MSWMDAFERLAEQLRATTRADGRRTRLVAVDGFGGAGKSTFAAALSGAAGDAPVVHLDDLVLGWEGGVDLDRVRAQVLAPLLADRPVRYQRYDWERRRMAEWLTVPAGGVVVIEGVSTLRREFGDPWDLRVRVETPRAICLERGLERDGGADRAPWGVGRRCLPWWWAKCGRGGCVTVRASARGTQEPCAACGASRRGAADRWCGSCGAPLTARSRRLSERERRRWQGRALVAAIVVAVIVGALATSRVADGLRDRFQDDVRQDEVTLPPADGAPERGGGDTRLGCLPAPCELWQAPAVDGRPVEVTDDLVLHAGRRELVAFDLLTGARLWSQPLPGAERTDAGTADVLHASGGVVAVAYGRHGQAEAQVLAFDLATGEPRFETVLDDAALISEVHRRGDQLLVDGGPRHPAGDSGPVLIVLDEDGQEVWRHEQAQVITLEDRLLEWDDADIRASRTDDGTEAWRREGLILDLDAVGDQVLLRTRAGGFEVVDIGTGGVVGSFPDDQADTAQFVGRWVGLHIDGAMRVVDPATGREILAREVAPPGEAGAVRRHVQHLALPEHTVIAWRDATGSQVIVYDRDGTRVSDWRLEGAGDDDWVGLTPVQGRPDLVMITSMRGRHGVWLELGTGAVVREIGGDGDDPRALANYRDGLIWSSEPAAMMIHGPYRSMTVEGATRLVSTDPLVVHGPAGMLRLDPQLLLGSADPAG